MSYGELVLTLSEHIHHPRPAGKAVKEGEKQQNYQGHCSK